MINCVNYCYLGRWKNRMMVWNKGINIAFSVRRWWLVGSGESGSRAVRERGWGEQRIWWWYEITSFKALTGHLERGRCGVPLPTTTFKILVNLLTKMILNDQHVDQSHSLCQQYIRLKPKVFFQEIFGFGISWRNIRSSTIFLIFPNLRNRILLTECMKLCFIWVY